jgi:hypothetical protein
MRIRRSVPALALLGALNVASATSADYPDKALFGDTHVHTGWSVDVCMDGAILFLAK